MKNLKKRIASVVLFFGLMYPLIFQVEGKKGDIQWVDYGIERNTMDAFMTLKNTTECSKSVKVSIQIFVRWRREPVKAVWDTVTINPGQEITYKLGPVPRNWKYILFIIQYRGCPEILTEREDIYSNAMDRFHIV